MGKLLSVLLIFFTAKSVQAAAGVEEWRWQKPDMFEIAVHVAAEALLFTDMLQTFDVKNHRGMTESNIVLGEHPGDAAILGYFAATAALSTALWYVTPQRARLFVDGTLIYFELPIVVNNRTHFGLRMRLPF